ncbi:MULTISPECIES: hypothetical protein [Bacillus cereus group]|uniref:Cthe-2314-like HEPN domain-containing protein n=1 Tax=Bacillus cereus VD048 TaxID=1053226 RepID=J8E6T4_BACCE|nr:hypothetical protein [Bacillus cereus]EJR26664.1 hypothetical protein IIG_05221 [Bacillus cereus VD048]
MLQQHSDRMLMIGVNLEIMREHIKKTNSYLTSLQDKVWHEYKNARYAGSLNEMVERSLSTLEHINIDIKYQRIMYRDIERLPQLFYSSFVITLCAFIENELYELCMYYWENYTKEKNPPNLNSYYKTKKYITKTMKLKIDKKQCDELETGIKKLRNQIAHKGPAFDRKLAEYQKEKSLSEMLKHIQNHNLVTTNGTYTYIKISFEYCIYLIEFTTDFFKKLFNNFNQLHLIKTNR